MKFIIGVLVTAAALWIATLIVPGIHIEASVKGFLIVALVFGLVNALVRPVARLLTLPVRILTLGLFSLVINAAMLMLTDWLAGHVMSIDGDTMTQLWNALLGSIVVSIASTLIHWIVPGD